MVIKRLGGLFMSRDLDLVIRERKSTRKFKSEKPPKELIDEILLAGLYSPYSGLTGIKLNEIRKFIVISNDCAIANEIHEMIYKQIRKKAKVFKYLVKLVPKLRKDGQGFNKRIQGMAKHGIDTLNTAPYYVIIAEKKGIPDSSNLSIAHVMQNMWLKATDLDLGFQVLSVTKIMKNNKEFLNKLGLDTGEYEIDGCLIGYPFSNIKKDKNLSLDRHVNWL